MREYTGTMRRRRAPEAGRPASVARDPHAQHPAAQHPAARYPAARYAAGGVLLAAVLMVGLAGCSAADAGGERATPSPVPSVSAEPTPSIPPTPDAALSPKQNLAVFDRAVQPVLAKNSSAPGARLLEALAAAGFDPQAMEVTPDRTTADLEADSIQFAVLFDGECLIGQRGPEDDGYHSMVAAPLGTGRCLLGSASK